MQFVWQPILFDPDRGIIVVALYAGVAELADALDLGSSGYPVQVQVLSPAPEKIHAWGLNLIHGFFVFVVLNLDHICS